MSAADSTDSFTALERGGAVRLPNGPENYLDELRVQASADGSTVTIRLTLDLPGDFPDEEAEGVSAALMLPRAEWDALAAAITAAGTR